MLRRTVMPAGLVKAGVWLNGSIARMQQLGVLHENHLWSLASESQIIYRAVEGFQKGTNHRDSRCV